MFIINIKYCAATYIIVLLKIEEMVSKMLCPLNGQRSISLNAIFINLFSYVSSHKRCVMSDPSNNLIMNSINNKAFLIFVLL